MCITDTTTVHVDVVETLAAINPHVPSKQHNIRPKSKCHFALFSIVTVIVVLARPNMPLGGMVFSSRCVPTVVVNEHVYVRAAVVQWRWLPPFYIRKAATLSMGDYETLPA